MVGGPTQVSFQDFGIRSEFLVLLGGRFIRGARKPRKLIPCIVIVSIMAEKTHCPKKVWGLDEGLGDLRVAGLPGYAQQLRNPSLRERDRERYGSGFAGV